MKIKLFPAKERGVKDIGWLNSKFSFSFSDYYNPDKSAFGTLVAFNDDTVQPGNGFGMHPHVNMEIISVLLQGKMNHKDSMGHTRIMDAGGVQIMSAGSGLFHEEYNVGEEEVKFLQIWIQPKLQDIKPRYQSRSFPKEKRKNKLQIIVSNEEGMDHCWINQNTKLSVGYFDAGSITHYSFNPVNKCIFIFCIEGNIAIDNHSLIKGDGIGIWELNEFDIHPKTEAEYIIVETVINQK